MAGVGPAWHPRPGQLPHGRRACAQAREQLTREPRPLPKLTILRRPPAIDAYAPEDFEIAGYEPHPHIKAEVAV